MKLSLAAACVLLLAACGSSPAPAASATSKKQVIGTFEGTVDLASGNMTLRPTGGTRSRSNMLVTIPESDGSVVDTVKVATVAGSVISTDAGGCEGADSFTGQVRLTNFYAVPLTNVYAVIDSVSSVGHEACNSDDSPGPELPVGSGLFFYDQLAATGDPEDSLVLTWKFAQPDTTFFTFTGHIVADDPAL